MFFNSSSPPAVHSPWPVARLCVSLMLVCAGLIIGVAAVQGKWLAVLAFFVLVPSLRWPVQTALGSIAVLLPFESVSRLGEGGMTLSWLAGAGAVGVLLLAGLATGRLMYLPRAARWWVLFIGWGAVTLLWAIDPVAAWARLQTAGPLLMLYLVATSYRMTRSELRWVTALTIAGGCAAAVISISEFFRGTLYQQSIRGSLILAGYETDPNQFAATLLLPISLALGVLLYFDRLLVRTLALGAVALTGLAVLLSMSRGGLVALGVLVLVYLRRFRVRRPLVLGVAALALTLLLLPESFYVRLLMADRGAGRFDVWIAAIHALPRYAIQGAGLNGFPAAFNEFAGTAPVFRGFARGPHNIYLGTIIELGIVGFVFLFLALRSQLREARNAPLPYIAACWAMLAAGFFLDVLWRKSFWFCWILLAIASRGEESTRA